jgi:hypothetical protein
MDEKLEFSEKADPAKKPLKKMYVNPRSDTNAFSRLQPWPAAKYKWGRPANSKRKIHDTPAMVSTRILDRMRRRVNSWSLLIVRRLATLTASFANTR